MLIPSSGVNVVVGLDAAGTIPDIAIGDIFFSFVEPGTNTASTTDSVSFTIGDAGGDLDQFQIRSYDLSNVLIDTQNVSNYSRFPVSINVPNIHRVEVDFLGTYGYGLDDLTFNQPGEGGYDYGDGGDGDDDGDDGDDDGDDDGYAGEDDGDDEEDNDDGEDDDDGDDEDDEDDGDDEEEVSTGGDTTHLELVRLFQ